VRDCWLEDEINGEWMVAYRLVPQNGRAVIAELRVYPGVPDSYVNAGEWSAEWDGNKVDVPAGGVSARLVQKELRFGSYLSYFSHIVGEMERRWGRTSLYDDGRLLARHGYSPAAPESDTRVGRPPEHDSTFLARLARDVNRAIANGYPKAPVKHLADTRDYPYTVEKMRRLVKRARDKGMLGPATPGLSGGQLTDRAKALLGEADEVEE
jgi:hypothetical protein